MPVGQQLNLAVVLFHQCRAVFHPVAAIIVGRVPDLPDDRAVNVAAKHALDIKPPGITNDRVLVGADKTDRVFHALLDRFAQ